MDKTDFRNFLFLAASAFLIRLPGCFWGVDLSHGGPFIFYSADEQNVALIVMRFVNTGVIAGRTDYFFGLVGQASPLAILRLFTGEFTLPQTVIAIRVINSLFAAGTVFLTCRIAATLFHSRFVSLLAGLCLAVFPLHIIESHRALPGVSMTFWTTASMYFCCLFTTENKPLNWYVGCVAAAASIAVKYGFITLVPLIYAAHQGRLSRRRLIFGMILFVLAFEVFNCGLPVGKQIHAIMTQLTPENFSGRRHNYWLNPFAYVIALIPGLGVIGFICAIKGLLTFFDPARPKSPALIFCFGVPLAIQAVGICAMSASFARHMLVFLPALAIFSAIGLESLKDMIFSRIERRFFIWICAVGPIFYQLTTVAWIEYRHLFAHGAHVRQWLIRTANPGETIGLGVKENGVGWNPLTLPASLHAASPESADFLILGESFVRLPFYRSILNPISANVDPDYRYGWNYLSNPVLVKSILEGNENYERASVFPAREIIPEFILYKHFFGTFNWLDGDWTVYRKLTPSLPEGTRS